MTALERSLVCFTSVPVETFQPLVGVLTLARRLWNYNPHNSDSGGDHWNGENFSIYSVKKSEEDYMRHDDGNSKLSKKHLYDGGRVLEAVLVIKTSISCCLINFFIASLSSQSC